MPTRKRVNVRTFLPPFAAKRLEAVFPLTRGIKTATRHHEIAVVFPTEISCVINPTHGYPSPLIVCGVLVVRQPLKV